MGKKLFAGLAAAALIALMAAGAFAGLRIRAVFPLQIRVEHPLKNRYPDFVQHSLASHQ